MQFSPHPSCPRLRVYNQILCKLRGFVLFRFLSHSSCTYIIHLKYSWVHVFQCFSFCVLHHIPFPSSLVAASRGYSSLRYTDLLRWPLLLQSTGSRCVGLVAVACGLQQLWLAGSRAQAQQLWRTGLVAPLHVTSSQTRTWTRVPCIDRRVLNHCATREACKCTFISLQMYFYIIEGMSGF